MTYDAKKHHRRSIRLEDYDYGQAGAYFVTVCMDGHVCLFGEVVDGDVRLNDAGKMVQAVWNELPGHYPGVETDAFVVMPNHVHAIIVLTGPSVVGAGPRACPDPMQPRQSQEMGQPEIGRQEIGQAPGIPEMGQPPGIGQPRGVAPTITLADVVHRFKTLTTKRYADGVKQCGWPPFPGRLWQRNYYEHIIRNDMALNRIRQYVAGNPARWAFDHDNPQATNPDPQDTWRG